MTIRPSRPLASRSAPAFCAAALLIVSSFAGAAPVLPAELRVGAYPVDAVGRAFTGYEFVPGSIAAVTDGSMETFIPLSGLDRVPFNNVLVDTGTFYLFRFRIDRRATEFHVDVTADAGEYPFKPFGDFGLSAVTPGATQGAAGFEQESAATPTTFGITFFRDSNTGNTTLPRNVGLDSLLTPSGDLFILLGGMFSGSLDHPGFVTTRLYEVNASSVVPEPAIPVGAMVGALALTRRRGRGPLRRK